MYQMLQTPTDHHLSCENWEIEGLLRLFLNSLHPNVAEQRDQLIVYGGKGKAARDLQGANAIIDELKSLQKDETLLIQSGKPVGKFLTFEASPRIVHASSILIPRWSNDEYFQQLVNNNLTMYGQSTAASWAYIGVQGVLQGTYETFVEIIKKHHFHTLKGKIVLTAGLGGMGTAQPLSVKMLGGVCIVVEVDEEKIDRRLQTNYCDIKVHTVEEAIKIAQEAAHTSKALTIALVGNVVSCFEEIRSTGFIPDIVTDQTSAHDLQNGYIPLGLTIEQAEMMRKQHKQLYRKKVLDSIYQHVYSMLHFQHLGSIVFEYGNNIRYQAYQAGLQEAFQIQGYTEAYLRPLYSEGRGPCRWISLTGNPDDIYTIDDAIIREFHNDQRIMQWIADVQKHIYFYGLPARTCWLNYEERIQIGLLINEMIRKGDLSGPIAITRDHSEASTMAAPYRETEKMKDGSDIVADWPILNALTNVSAGASMVSVQNGGGMGVGNSVHSGMTVIADGTKQMDTKLENILTVDPKLSIIRHADAGYYEAVQRLKCMEGVDKS